MTLLKTDQRQMLIWAAVALAICVILYSLSTVLTPFLFGAILAYVLNPGVNYLGRHSWPRSLAALLMIILMTIVFVILAVTIIPLLQRELGQLQHRLPDLLHRLNTAVSPRLEDWFGIHLQFSGYSLRKLISDQWANEDLMSTVMASLKIGGVALLALVANLFLIPIATFYLLVDWEILLKKVEAAMPRRWHALLVSMAREVDGVLAQFLRGQLSVMLILATYYSVTLALAGFDVALPIGICTGVLVFVPYLGFATGLSLATLAAVLQFQGWYGLGAVALIYGFGQVVESFYLTPKIVGKRIGLHPLAVIFALLAFGEIFGFFGVLLALPASAVLLVGLRRIKALYINSAFYLRP